MIAATDCAGRPNQCQIWALPEDHADQNVAVGLEFDGTHPPVSPQATVDPATALHHQQPVIVAGAHFFPDLDAEIMQCATGPSDQQCRFLADTQTDDAGGFTANVAVSRRVGLTDCAVVACVVSVSTYPADPVTVAIAFDPSVPPPPVPSATVEPHAGLVDWQTVNVKITGADPDSFVNLSLCTADRSACRGNVSQAITDAAAVISLALPRLVAPDRDCAVVACFVDVQLYGADSYEFTLPVGFDPKAPLAPPSSMRVLLAAWPVGSSARRDARRTIRTGRECVGAAMHLADTSSRGRDRRMQAGHAPSGREPRHSVGPIHRSSRARSCRRPARLCRGQVFPDRGR